MLRLTIRDAAPENYHLRQELLEAFILSYEKRKRCHPKSDFQL